MKSLSLHPQGTYVIGSMKVYLTHLCLSSTAPTSITMHISLSRA